jgi:dTDP-4-amino-4,6-dideoxygalactose transaminase
MGGAEEIYIKEAFETNWVAPLGPNVNQFEVSIVESLSSSLAHYSAALTSGTAALHLALRMLDVESSDVVMVQSFTFCGTTNPVSYQGAEIVFIDSEPDTWNMCPEALAQAMADYKGKKVKAIMPVHLYGMPAKMDQIQLIGDQYQVPIIEDAAEALGSTLYGQA